jgi:uncharacterized membrane protein
MTGWLIFALAFVVFFLTHTVPVRPGVKARLQDLLGRRGFTTAYSALSLAVLGGLIWAAAQPPYVHLWAQNNAQRYVVLAGMTLACLVAGFAIGRPNPFSFGGAHNDRFDPDRPGIVRLTRHPLLLTLALWAGLHLLPNGDLAHVILFGVFLGFALLGRWIIDRRNRRLIGADTWHALAARTARAPLFQAPASWSGFAVRLGWAVGALLLLLALHPVVIGASPLPV